MSKAGGRWFEVLRVNGRPSAAVWEDGHPAYDGWIKPDTYRKQNQVLWLAPLSAGDLRPPAELLKEWQEHGRLLTGPAGPAAGQDPGPGGLREDADGAGVAHELRVSSFDEPALEDPADPPRRSHYLGQAVLQALRRVGLRVLGRGRPGSRVVDEGSR